MSQSNESDLTRIPSPIAGSDDHRGHQVGVPNTIEVMTEGPAREGDPVLPPPMQDKIQAAEGEEADTPVPDVVQEYFRELQARIHDQEASLDKAILLLAGGALSVSAAFVSALKPPLNWVPLLAVSWCLWLLALGAVLVAYPISVQAHKRVQQLLLRGEYDSSAYNQGLASLISPMNFAAVALVIFGFISFVVFSLKNIPVSDSERTESADVREGPTSNEKIRILEKQKEGILEEKGLQESVSRGNLREHSAAAQSEVAKALSKSDEEGKGVRHVERQDKSPSTAEPTRPTK